MAKVTFDLDIKDVEKLIKKLSISDKIRLVRKLEQETWAKRLDEVVSQVRKKFKKAPLSDKEITKICKQTRRRLYNERAKGNN